MDISEEQENHIIDSDNWHSMSLPELYQQKTIIGNRIEIAYTLKNIPVLNSLQQGLLRLEYYINLKLSDSDKNNKSHII